jgi:hypothetical protein
MLENGNIGNPAVLTRIFEENEIFIYHNLTAHNELSNYST